MLLPGNLLARIFSPAAVAKTADALPALTVPGWADDSSLRKLAQSYRDGETKWVLAADMDEFFTKLDNHNASKSFEERVSLCVEAGVAKALDNLMQKEMHIEDKRAAATNGPLVLKGDSLLRLMGPQSLGGLQLRHGDEACEAAYQAGPLNTRLHVQSPDGGWKKIEFGMDGACNAFANAGPSLTFKPS